MTHDSREAPGTGGNDPALDPDPDPGPDPGSRPARAGIGARIAGWIAAGRRHPERVWPFLLVLGVAGILALLVATRSRPDAMVAQEQRWTVEVAPLRLRDIQPWIRSYGTVVAGRVADLRALVPGRVIALSDAMVEGGVVRTGEVLFRIDPFEARAREVEARAQLAEAQAQLEQIRSELASARRLLKVDRRQLALRERDLGRRRALVESRSLSSRGLEEGQVAANSAEAQVETRQQQSRVLAAREAQASFAVERTQSALRRARRDLQHTEFRAPFSGFLAEVNLALGKRVGTGETLARLIDADRLEARVQISEGEFARLIDGPRGREALLQRVGRIDWQVGGRDLSWPMRITRIAAQIDSRAGGVTLFGRIEGSGLDSLLRPGAFVQVTLPDRIYRRVHVLPATAVGQEGEVYSVEDDRLVEHRVEVVWRGGGQLAMRSALPEGTRLVLRRFPEIGPGLWVRPVGPDGARDGR